jgi:hypothetical protein
LCDCRDGFGGAGGDATEGDTINLQTMMTASIAGPAAIENGSLLREP